jgi:MraZ protein
MFRGNYPTRMDEKGRLKMPADFKHELDEGYGTKFFITSFDGKRAKIFPMKTWEGIEKSMQKMAATDPIRKRFLDVTNYWGQPGEMDTQGRLLIPQRLRDAVKATGVVCVLGAQDHLELVNEEAFEAELRGDGGVIALTETENAAFAEKTQPKDL